MRKEEILLKDFDLVETKPNKVKIILSILASTLVVASIATLLIGHFQFDWFKSNEYNSIAELQDKFLSAMSFDEMVSFNESDAEILAFFNNTHTNSTENSK